MQFTIYASDKDAVQKMLEKIGKKADKYGVQFTFAFSDVHPQTIRVFNVIDYVRQYVNSFTVEAVDVEIDADGLIKADGWKVLAKIEHGEEGNIVTPFGCEPESAWYGLAPRCDHCGTNRRRSVTFLVQNESGEIRQVGKSCLKDYTGIDPATAALWASVWTELDDDMDCSVEEWESRGAPKMWATDEIIGHAVDVIQKLGYRKADGPDSTKSRVLSLLGGDAPSEEGLKKAREISAWLIANAEEFKIGLERDCIALVKSGFAKKNHVGRLAFLPVAYERWMAEKEKTERREKDHKEAVARSEYVGSVGERITVKAASAKLLTSWETIYGTTFLYRFVDERGNVFVWKASVGCDVNDGMTIKGTVKDHSEYDGVKQTVLTRCKAA